MMYHTFTDTILYFKKELNYSDDEIKKLTVPQVNLILQRTNEPIYKQQIEQKLKENETKIRKAS